MRDLVLSGSELFRDMLCGCAAEPEIEEAGVLEERECEAKKPEPRCPHVARDDRHHGHTDEER